MWTEAHRQALLKGHGVGINWRGVAPELGEGAETNVCTLDAVEDGTVLNMVNI